MKHSPATTGLLTLTIALLTFVFWLTSCGRFPRSYPSDAGLVETSSSGTKASVINVNTASAAELEKLPGVGAILAERIITHRNEHGRFRRAEHLMMVRGISDRKFRALQSLIRAD